MALCTSIFAILAILGLVRIDQERRCALRGERLARIAGHQQSLERQEADRQRGEAVRLREVSDRALWKASLAEVELRLRDDAPGRRRKAVDSVRQAWS